jgi:predicted Fe-Mo cluster-binding NifX family protein
MLACVPVTEAGQVSPGWGRANRVAVAEVADGRVVDWREITVAWDRLHDTTTEGGHHARVARFLLDNRIDTVMAHHMGEGMRRMLDRMGIGVRLGIGGDARQAVLAGAAREPATGAPLPDERMTR